MYTLFYEASTLGAPVLRPLFFDFGPSSLPRGPLPAVEDIDSQFMIGKAVMISPVLTPNTNSLKGKIRLQISKKCFEFSLFPCGYLVRFLGGP